VETEFEVALGGHDAPFQIVHRAMRTQSGGGDKIFVRLCGAEVSERVFGGGADLSWQAGAGAACCGAHTSMMNDSSPAPASLTPNLDWLYGTQLYGMKPGLDNTRRLLEETGLPGAGVRFLHVAGTNGKGSTCAFMHSMLGAAGVRAGLFTSPHLVRFNERIRDTEREITDAEIESGLARIRALVADWQPHPTFFEITLALALDWFQARGLEWVVLETGLGGRLDATNVVTPEVAVITRIGMDHMAQLGGTLAEIAAEKAGIIKPGVPVVTGPQEPEALRVIKSAARSKKAPLIVVDAPLNEVPLGLSGPHQGWNAALAVAALRETGLPLPALVMEQGLRETVWPARFQSFGQGRVILDGAHNPDAARALAEAWRAAFPGENAVVVFGGSSGKDHAETLLPLMEISARWVLTGFDSPRSVPLPVLEEAFLAAGGEARLCEQARTLPEALALASRHGARVLICGSLFLAGEYLALRAQERHQPSEQ